MLKRTTAMMMAITMIIMLLPCAVFADGSISIFLETSEYTANDEIFVFYYGITQEMVDNQAYIAIYEKGADHSAYMSRKSPKVGDGELSFEPVSKPGEYEVRLYNKDFEYTDEIFMLTVPFIVSGAGGQQVSDWAKIEIEKAAAINLIPDTLKNADLTMPITRAEFAAVSVKLYEKLSGNTAVPAETNPFNDTWDWEVLKAYNTGITAGVSDDEFAPDALLNREQAATMLTRVFKKAFIENWSLKDDGKFTFNYAAPPKFADDAKISEWAKPSVYFMAAHGIISGTGGNNFAPEANAAREQALVIAVRMTENLNEADASEIKQ